MAKLIMRKWSEYYTLTHVLSLITAYLGIKDKCCGFKCGVPVRPVTYCIIRSTFEIKQHKLSTNFKLIFADFNGLALEVYLYSLGRICSI